MSVLSERLKELRLEGRLEQQEVADAVKISKSSLQKYENGIQAPTRLKLEALANFYQVRIPYAPPNTNPAAVRLRGFSFFEAGTQTGTPCKN